MNEIYFLTFCRSILKIGKPGIDIILLSPTSIHSLYSDFLTNLRNDLFSPPQTRIQSRLMCCI